MKFVEPGRDLIRRFWKEATVAPDRAGWGVRLDGRPLRTPGKRALTLPSPAAAGLIAGEWNAQDETLDAETMPASRLANTAIDHVAGAREPVAEEITAFAGSDALCYLADGPATLVERQTREWAPWRAWAATELVVDLQPTDRLCHLAQNPGALARVRGTALALDDFALTGLAAATPLLGSAILALALQRGALSGETAFDLSRLDEAFQEERWGVDAEAAARTAARRAEAALLDRWFRALEATP